MLQSLPCPASLLIFMLLAGLQLEDEYKNNGGRIKQPDPQLGELAALPNQL